MFTPNDGTIALMRQPHYHFFYFKSRLFLLLLLLIGCVGLARAQNITITNINPAANANHVAINSNITITFDQPINSATLTSSNLVVRGSQTGVIAGTWSGGGSAAITFNPAKDFRLGEVISITISPSLKSISNFGLSRGHTYSFTAISGPSPVTPTTFAQRHIAFNNIQEEDVAAMDYEGDGDLDFFISGYVGLGTGYTYLWENDGSQGFCPRVVGYNRNVEMFDIDGDGDLDNFSSGGNDTNLYWQRNDGTAAPTQQFIGSTLITWSASGGDLDSDGDIDAVAAISNAGGTNFLIWFINNGAGGFTPGGTIASISGGSYTRYRVIDINKDGAMDIVGYDQLGLKLTWLQNNGSQIFTEKPIATFASNTDYQRIAWGDVDGDGDIDVFSGALNSPPTLRWFENDGSGIFTTHTLPVTGGNTINYVRVVDVDGDLDMDLMAGGYWFQNDGAQNFTQVGIPGLATGPSLYYAISGNYADMEGDGDMDLITLGLNHFSWQENGKFMNVTGTSPAHAKFDVSANANIVLTFDQAVSPASVNTTAIRLVSKLRGPVPGTFTGGGTNTITFDPAQDFLPGDQIEVSINNKLVSTTGHNLQTNYGFDFRVKVTVSTPSPKFTTSSIKIHTSTVTGMDVADMDNDGDPDMLSCSSTELYWHKNNGSGSFTTIAIATSTSPRQVFATDVNQDGHMDLFVRGTLSYFYVNDGNQNFIESGIVSNAGNVTNQITDVDRDGDDDIVMTGSRWADRYCGVYGVGIFPNVIGNRAIRAGDMDGDGDMDLMGAGTGGSVLYSNSYLRFTNSAIDPTNAYQLDLADLDGDGDLDPIYALTNSSVVWYPNNLNTASNNFNGARTLGGMADPRSVTVADIDGDGDPDVAAVSRSNDNIVWYRNRLNEATADFAAGALLPLTSDGPISIASGDFNGDGRIDLAVISDIDNELAWFSNLPSTFPSITGFTPTSGLVGATVTITGTNFSTTPSNNTVQFNGTLAVVTASTATNITTTVPTGATTGPITVTVSGNTATSATPFTVNTATTPTITGFTPTSGLVGTTVIITGTNFSTTPSANTVRFNGTLTTVTASTATSITTTVPFGATSGKITVLVAGKTATSATNFIVPPAITAFTPSGPIGAIVTITGTNFDPIETNNIVSFNGTDGIVYSSSLTDITVEVPAGATTGPITVTVGAFSATSSGPFTVITCSAARTNGEIDATYDPLIQDVVSFTAIEIQSTGKSIVAVPDVTINGTAVRGVVRFNADGTLDGSFNAIDIDPSAGQMLIQPDNKIIAVNNSGTDTFLDRYLADGTKDVTFTTLTYSLAVTYPNYFGTIALQPDGKILYTLYNSFDGLDQLLRLNADGTPDATFTGPTGLLISTIRVQPDGKILIGTDIPGIYRLDNLGNIDSGFDPGVGTDGSVADIAIQPNGDILISGFFTTVNGTSRNGIARLHPDGSLDASFNPGLGSDSYIYFMRLLSNGQIIISTGFTRYDIAPRANLAKINSDGSLDCSFDPGASADGTINDLAIQADEKILLAGDFTTYDGGARNALVRVNNLLNAPTITVTLQPSAVTVCTGTTAMFSTSATGTTGIAYQWQFSTNIAPLVFSDIADGATYTGASTNTLTINTAGSTGAGRYRCKITGDAASTVYSIDEGLTLNPVPVAPTVTGSSGCGPTALTLSASGGTNGQYRWYTVANGGVAIPGAVNNTFATPLLAVTTTYYVGIASGTCESTRTAVTATIISTGCSNSPPLISSSTASTVIGGTATLSLVALLSDPDNNLDISTLKIVTQPASGAKATIDGNNSLVVDYTGSSFVGSDAVTIEVCDLSASCVQKTLTIEVYGDIVVYNAVSPNGENPIFFIQHIESLPETKANTVTIFDRWQNEVWRGDNYDNTNVVFQGVRSDGVGLLPGVYFYRVSFASGRKALTGFISLKK